MEIVRSMLIHVHNERSTIRTIRDGEPRTATSTYTQLLSSVYESSVHRDHTDAAGRGDHLDFHTAPEQ